ncbi:heavy-metal-associated domain-containing protein [Melioribacter sp. OK-6-Me]|uniref:heavy-metal-associated domain-containing protein n=1 Tax=unclassified Melioribacter TaxID=2627329 RepID=UPI003ED9303E
MQSKEFKIEGMSCQHCVMAVKKELSSLNLESAEVEIGKAKVIFDETKVTEEQIINAIEEAGYKVIEN